MMRTKLTADEARRFLIEVADPATTALWQIQALDKNGPPLPGDVSPALIGDILQAQEVDTWPQTARRIAARPSPFRAFIEMPRDGVMYRSFIPEDLKADDESRVREFASHSNNPLVRGRIFHVLWVRFAKFIDAKAAYEARFLVADQLLPDGAWPEIVSNLGHIITLLRHVNATTEFPALLDVLDRTAATFLGSDKTFSFTVFVDVLSNTWLDKKPGRDAFTKARADKWAAELDSVATRYKDDSHHGHDALIVLQDWYSRWGEASKRDATRRRAVEQLLDVAVARRDAASWLIQQALQTALDSERVNTNETASSKVL